MKKTLVLGSLFLAICALSGCGANADSLMKQDIKAMNDLADAVESKAPEAKVAELKTKLEEINKKLEALKLSDEDKKKLIEQHKDELVKAQMRILKAQNKEIADAFLGQGFLGMPDLGKMLVLPGLPGPGEKVSVRYDSIAVLPFTGDALKPLTSQLVPKEYLDTELPAAVAREIAKIGPGDALKVIAPAVVREKQDQKVDLRTLGQLLGAKVLLKGEGKGRNSNRIEFQLIVAQDGTLLWGDSVEIKDFAVDNFNPQLHGPTAGTVAELVVRQLTGKK